MSISNEQFIDIIIGRAIDTVFYFSNLAKFHMHHVEVSVLLAVVILAVVCLNNRGVEAQKGRQHLRVRLATKKGWKFMICGQREDQYIYSVNKSWVNKHALAPNWLHRSEQFQSDARSAS